MEYYLPMTNQVSSEVTATAGEPEADDLRALETLRGQYAELVTRIRNLVKNAGTVGAAIALAAYFPHIKGTPYVRIFAAAVPIGYCVVMGLFVWTLFGRLAETKEKFSHLRSKLSESQGTSRPLEALPATTLHAYKLLLALGVGFALHAAYVTYLVLET